MGIKFGEFDMSHDSWVHDYITRFEFCLNANDIKDEDKKKANLLAVCGSQLFDLIVSLSSPVSIRDIDITYKQILIFLKAHFHPTPNEIVESFKFHSRNQEEGEKVRDYVASLRKMSIHCNFTDLDRTLRDQLVCGLRNKEVQRKLLQCNKLTFTQASEIAFSHESATFDSSIIIVPEPAKPNMEVDEPMEVNKITNREYDKQSQSCFRCGKQHKGECRFRWSKCNFCSNIGHIEPVCPVKNKKDGGHRSNCNGLYTKISGVREDKVDAYRMKVSIEGSVIEMEMDSGCAFTLISETTARLIWNGKLPVMEGRDVTVTTWTENDLNILGKIRVQIGFKELQNKLIIYIARGYGPSTIGRNWFEPLGIRIEGVTHQKINSGESLLQKYGEVFQEGLGKYKGPVVSITPRKGSVPTFLKSRPIPIALRERVIMEIDRLVDEGVLVPTARSEWATPIVPVLKQDGKVGLCGDYRSTVNLVTDTDTYPLPTRGEVFTAIQGGKVFSIIVLERAYTQVGVDEATAQLLTINTPKGLYKMTRLAFGVKVSPGIFQRLMSSLLAGIRGIAVVWDDIVVSGTDGCEHNSRLEMVLKRLQGAGLRVNKEKCYLGVKSVMLLGFLIDESGIHPCEDKIHGIESAPAPTNVKELQAFLVLLNLCDSYIPQKANIAEPLYKLLNKDVGWQWTTLHQKAFEKLRSMLLSKDMCDQNQNTQVNSFKVGQTVYFRNYSSGPHWLKGVIEKRQGICRYIIQWNGKLMKRHINQIQSLGGEKRDTRQRITENLHREIGHRTGKKNKQSRKSDSDDENDVQVFATPPVSQWAKIIAVSGPQGHTINQSQDHIPPAKKRTRSSSLPQGMKAKKVVIAYEENLLEFDHDPGNTGNSEHDDLGESEL